MPKTIKVDLPVPVTGHNGLLRQATLREPTFDDYLELGDPEQVAATSTGAFFTIENAEAVATYVRRCLVDPDELTVAQGGVQNARAIKKAVLGFFRDGEPAAEVLPTSPTSLSSSDTPASATSAG